MAQIVHNSSAPIRSKLFETQQLHTKYDVIRAVLSRRAHTGLAAYFAVPNVDPEGHQIVWSTATSTSSRPIPLADLPPSERASLLAKVQRLHDELYLFKEGIADTVEGRSLKALLTMLQDVPDGRHIYRVDDQPVFIYWSHEQEQPLGEIEYPRLERIDRRRTAPPPAAASTASTTALPPPVTVATRPVVVAHGVLVFVGAVSFFGIALASMCLAALSLYYLVTGGHWSHHSNSAVTVIAEQVS